MSIEINKNPLVIGFSGRAKCGKDTAAHAIASIIPNVFDVEILSFAEPIRKIGEIFGYTREQMDNQSLKETYRGNLITNMTPRKFLQTVGTDMFRKCIDKDIWVKLLESKIGTERNPTSTYDLWKPSKVVIITDVRFPNESEMIKSHGGFVIGIERPSLANFGDWSNHESEQAMSEVIPDCKWSNDSKTQVCWCGKAIELFGEWMNSNNISFNTSTF